MDQRVGGSIGLRTLNERVHALAQLVPLDQQEWVEDVPPATVSRPQPLPGTWPTVLEHELAQLEVVS